MRMLLPILAVGTFGDLGRNEIFGPHFWNVDFAVSKNTQLFEQVEFAAAGGVLQHLQSSQFRVARISLWFPGFGPAGLITQTPDQAQTNPGLGGGGPRVVQMAAKFTF